MKTSQWLLWFGFLVIAVSCILLSRNAPADKKLSFTTVGLMSAMFGLNIIVGHLKEHWKHGK